MSAAAVAAATESTAGRAPPTPVDANRVRGIPLTRRSGYSGSRPVVAEGAGIPAAAATADAISTCWIEALIGWRVLPVDVNFRLFLDGISGDSRIDRWPGESQAGSGSWEIEPEDMGIATASASYVEKAYRLAPHRRTVFQPASARMPASQRAYPAARRDTAVAQAYARVWFRGFTPAKTPLTNKRVFAYTVRWICPDCWGYGWSKGD